MVRPTRLFLVLVVLGSLATATFAQSYQTPGIGITWDFDDLVANSGGIVTGGGGSYVVHGTVIVAPTDRIEVAAGAEIVFDVDPGQGLDVAGALVASGTEAAPIVFRGAVAEAGAWRGFDIDDTAAAFQLTHCEIAHAVDAVDAFGADIELVHCEIHTTLAKVIDITSADGLVSNCHLHDNRQRTITMSLSASPTIEFCHFEENNQENSSPYPYLNIGLQGVNSPTIRGNTILGSGHEISGGIAIWNASDALIEDNLIEGCGYGILCFQTGANPRIIGNTIRDNTINPDTVNWGFGVACNGSNAPILMQNTITGHWYGVAAINGGQPNLGDLVNDFPGDDGGNVIVDNGLDGQIYGFYNNTPLPQMAQGNWWGGATEAEVEAAIYHQPDEPGLGLVNFAFWLETVGAALAPAAVLAEVDARPNPFNPRVAIAFTLAVERPVSLAIFDVRGRLVQRIASGALAAGAHELFWDGADQAGRPQSSGTYHYRLVAGNESHTGKLMLVR